MLLIFGVEWRDHTLRTTGRKVVNSITLVIAYPGHVLFRSSMSGGTKVGTHANKLFAGLN